MSPREIPGVPFGKLPDKRSKGRCLNPKCFRTFRSVKVEIRPNNKPKHRCPFCGSDLIIITDKD